MLQSLIFEWTFAWRIVVCVYIYKRNFQWTTNNRDTGEILLKWMRLGGLTFYGQFCVFNLLRLDSLYWFFKAYFCFKLMDFRRFLFVEFWSKCNQCLTNSRNYHIYLNLK